MKSLMKSIRVMLIFCMLGMGVGVNPPAFALTPEERLDNPALEARARALSLQLRCLVCQNQSIDDSDAPLARDMRRLIREKITAGESDEEIINFLRARYGDFVLLDPPFGAATAALWLAPAVFLLCGIAGIAIARSRRAGKSVANKAQKS